jgi:hypothetical protein
MLTALLIVLGDESDLRVSVMNADLRLARIRAMKDQKPRGNEY